MDDGQQIQQVVDSNEHPTQIIVFFPIWVLDLTKSD